MSHSRLLSARKVPGLETATSVSYLFLANCVANRNCPFRRFSPHTRITYQVVSEQGVVVYELIRLRREMPIRKFSCVESVLLLSFINIPYARR